MRRRMMRWVGVLVVGGWLVTTLAAQTAQADPKQPNLSAEKGKEEGAAAVSLLSRAAELVQYAHENESPVAMLTAVQMLERVQVQDNAERVGSKKTGLQHEGEQVKEGKKGETPAPTLDPQKLLAEAKPWAKGNQSLLALIDAEAAKAKAASAGTLGSTRGAIAHRDSVGARNYDDYVINFYSGQVARVGIVGDGDTDVDLFVFDQNGNEIARDDDRSAECLVQFTPRWTGPFRVRVVNNGYVYSNYILMTN
jgi:4-amino-4-deoxy-L-arabinose transferase-like glycosyltransferase